MRRTDEPMQSMNHKREGSPLTIYEDTLIAWNGACIDPTPNTVF